MERWKRVNGFTIVELLIVVVVIAILAAITVLSYNGIQNRAYDSAIQTDLKELGTKALAYITTEIKTLPLNDDVEMAKIGFSVSSSAYGSPYIANGQPYNLVYCWSSSPIERIGFVAASKSGKVFIFRDGTVSEGVGPLVTYTTTCSNNGLPGNASWFYNAGNWRWVRT